MTTYARVTVIVSDKVCTIDGVTATNIDMSSLPTNLHAMQWYGTWGEEEYVNLVTQKMDPNVRITSLDAYSVLFEAFNNFTATNQQQEAEAAAQQTITEV